MTAPRECAVTAEPLLVRRATTQRAIECGESTLVEFEAWGWLTPIRVPGLHAVFYSWEEVKLLAERIRKGDLDI